MAYLKTTNALSLSFGPSPTTTKQISSMSRGYIFYIEMSAQHVLRIRQFYCDYGKSNGGTLINNQLEFEKYVLEYAARPEENQIGEIKAFNRYYIDNIPSPATKRPFPYILSNNADEVHFGCIPCHVTYIFNTAYFKFIETSPDACERPLDPRQPMVLRSSKVIRDRNGDFFESNYEYPNDSFFNLTVDNNAYPNVSVMRFDNIMDHANLSYAKQYCMDIYIDVPTDMWRSQINELIRNFTIEAEKQGIINVNLTKDYDQKLDGITISNFINNFVESLYDPKDVGVAPAPNNWVIMVFDPPQTNGGTGGPPN